MANRFLDFLESMSIAMEADDITGQVANDVKSAVGGTPSTQTEPQTREDEEDIGKVDDIFGTETPDDATPPTGTVEDDSTGEEEDPMMDENLEESPKDTGDEDLNTEEDTNLDESTNDDSAGNPDLVFTKKNRVRDNLVQLYTIISGNIEIISNSLTGINDSKTVEVINIIINHLYNAKKYIYNTLTKDLKSLEYDELLQRYITIKRVYDICIEMMETHFKKDEKK